MSNKEYWDNLETEFKTMKDKKIKKFSKQFTHTGKIFESFQPDNEGIIEYIANKYKYSIIDEKLFANKSIYTFKLQE